MRRLLIFTLLLSTTLGILSRLAITLGTQQPLPAKLAMLHFDICAAPCWIGITPGKTTVGEATAIIASKFGYADKPVQAYFSDDGELLITIFSPHDVDLI